MIYIGFLYKRKNNKVIVHVIHLAGEGVEEDPRGRRQGIVGVVVFVGMRVGMDGYRGRIE